MEQNAQDFYIVIFFENPVWAKVFAHAMESDGSDVNPTARRKAIERKTFSK